MDTFPDAANGSVDENRLLADIHFETCSANKNDSKEACTCPAMLVHGSAQYNDVMAKYQSDISAAMQSGDRVGMMAGMAARDTTRRASLENGVGGVSGVGVGCVGVGELSDEQRMLRELHGQTEKSVGALRRDSTITMGETAAAAAAAAAAEGGTYEYTSFFCCSHT